MLRSLFRSLLEGSNHVGNALQERLAKIWYKDGLLSRLTNIWHSELMFPSLEQFYLLFPSIERKQVRTYRKYLRGNVQNIV